MSDETGKIVECASRDKEEILYHEYELDAICEKRMSWGLFIDRRLHMYSDITE